MSVINIGSVSLSGTDQLSRIEKNIDTLIDSITRTSLVFTPLSFSPTFSTNSSNGWVTAPTNLSNITDGDINTSTNTFEVGGLVLSWGDVIINPNVSLTQFTRINSTLAIRSNNNGQRPALQIDVFSSSWVTIWSIFAIPMSDSVESTFSIDIITPFSWTQLRWRIWDLGTYATRCRISDFKLWSVS